jgi:iron complex transport system substrate-binding protein
LADVHHALDEIQLGLGAAPRRVVSLVPSYTESLFVLGLGEAVVGVTDYCTEPAEALCGLVRVGGPKDPRVGQILALAPDLVIANQEENSPATVAALDEAGIPVWVSFPRTAQAALDVLWGLVDLFSSPSASLQVRLLEDSLDWAVQTQDTLLPQRMFCPIWQGKSPDGESWWMTFNRDTYSHDLLTLFGMRNLFTGRVRRYPLDADLGRVPAEPANGRDTRYPCVTCAEVLAGDPEVIVLPDEPFAFDEDSAAQLTRDLAETSAVRNGRVIRLDGRLITWYGVRLSQALQALPLLLGV